MATAVLDQFRALLDHFDAEDRADVLAFFQFVGLLEEEALEELGPRLQKTIAPRLVRLVVLEVAFYYPWPGWLEFLGKLLRHEVDLEVFESGARAIGRIRGTPATKLLRELYTIRQAEAFQAVLGRALVDADPAEAFSYHLGRLLEGSGNPRIANEAAAELTRVVSVEVLPELLEVVWHPDLLIARHALRLVTHIHAPEAAAFLLAHLQECHLESLADRRLKEDLGFFRGGALPARADVLERLQQAFGATAPEALASLALESEGLNSTGAAALQNLRDSAVMAADVFLLDASILALEGKSAKVAALANEALEGLNQRSRRLTFAVDTCAEGLGSMVRHRVIDASGVLAEVAEAYRLGTGREGLARMLGQLVSPKDHETLALIMAGADPSARGAALEAIGVRREEDMLPFLLSACADPIVDIAQKAMVALGQLGGAPGTVLRLVLSSNLEEARLGIRIAGINRMEGAASVLLEFLERNTREELSLEAIEALGAIGLASSGDALLDLLHSGLSARVQIAMAQAIRDMGHPDLAISLCTKATQLRNGHVTAAATESLLRAYPEPSRAMPPGAFRAFREQVQNLWEDKDPWPLRYRLVEGLERLYCQEPNDLEEMATLVQGALGDKRIHGIWSLEQQNRAASVVKELGRRAAERRKRG